MINTDNLALGNIAKGFLWTAAGCTAAATASLALVGSIGCLSKTINAIANNTLNYSDRSALVRYTSLGLGVAQWSLAIGTWVAATALGTAITAKGVGICLNAANTNLSKSPLFSALPSVIATLREVGSHIVLVHRI